IDHPVTRGQCAVAPLGKLNSVTAISAVTPQLSPSSEGAVNVRYLAPFFLAGVLAAGVASAAKPPSPHVRLGNETLQKLTLGSAQRTNAACQLGVTGAPAFTFDYFL